MSIKVRAVTEAPVYCPNGTDDLRALLPTLKTNLATEGNEVFILIRPFIHSMAVYLRVIDDNKILCHLGDSQGWHSRFYPTPNIINLLNIGLDGNRIRFFQLFVQ